MGIDDPGLAVGATVGRGVVGLADGHPCTGGGVRITVGAGVSSAGAGVVSRVGAGVMMIW